MPQEVRMPKASLRVLLVILLVSLCGLPLDGCGDQLLVLGRGVRFLSVRAEYPASILHYINPLKVDPTVKDTNLRSFLGQAGHKLQSVRSAKEFEESLRIGKYDLILIDFSDAPNFAEIIQSAASQPSVLPFVLNGKKEDISTAKKRYGIALKAPFGVQHLLDTIDDAMVLRHKRQKTT